MNSEEIKKYYTSKDGLKVGESLNPDFLGEIRGAKLKEYLSNCLSERNAFVSDVYLMSAEYIDAMCDDPDAFGHFLNNENFLPIAQSMATDVIAVEKKTEEIYWFNSTVFLDGLGSLINPNNEEVEINRENLEKV